MPKSILALAVVLATCSAPTLAGPVYNRVETNLPEMWTGQHSVIVVDLDRDGHDDLLVGYNGFPGTRVSWFRNSGDALNFSETVLTQYPEVFDAPPIALLDADRDGRTDVAVLRRFLPPDDHDNEVRLLHRQGDSTTWTDDLIDVPGFGGAIQSLRTASGPGLLIEYWHGYTRHLGFNQIGSIVPTATQLAIRANDIASADFDHDGDDDFISRFGSLLRVFRQTDALSFTQIDLAGSALPDAARFVPDAANGPLAVAFRRPQALVATFSCTTSCTPSFGTMASAPVRIDGAADLDGDGDIDFFGRHMATTGTASVAIIERNSGASPWPTRIVHGAPVMAVASLRSAGRILPDLIAFEQSGDIVRYRAVDVAFHTDGFE